MQTGSLPLPGCVAWGKSPASLSISVLLGGVDGVLGPSWQENTRSYVCVLPCTACTGPLSPFSSFTLVLSLCGVTGKQRCIGDPSPLRRGWEMPPVA